MEPTVQATPVKRPSAKFTPRKRPAANRESSTEAKGKADTNSEVKVKTPPVLPVSSPQKKSSEKKPSEKKSGNIVSTTKFVGGWTLFQMETKSKRVYPKYVGPNGPKDIHYSKSSAKLAGFVDKEA